MSVFADDLFLAGRRDRLDVLKKSIDDEMRIVWGDLLQEGSGWTRYLGKEWRCHRGRYEVRVPVLYWEELLKDNGLDQCRSVTTPGEVKSE
eukprot:6022471-Heterocapsa_arctica.AAC.1